MRYSNPTPDSEGNSRFRGSFRLLTRSLFLEESMEPDRVLFSLKDNDTKGFPSLRRLYLEADDPLESTFAQKYFESQEHWERVCECDWFIPHITRWRYELELMIRARALQAIREEAMGDTKNSFQANKFLVTGGWKKKEDTPSAGRGRPSKKEITEAAEKMARVMGTGARVEEDAKRLGIPFALDPPVRSVN